MHRSLVGFIHRIFGHVVLAKHVHHHAQQPASEGDDICDFRDGSTYADVQQDPRFAADPRNLMVGVITDGVQPFKEDKQYSMWPIMVTLYNFPPWKRYLLAVSTLVGIQAGRRTKRAYNWLQPVLQVLMDELKLLDCGVRVWDAYKREWFTCYAKLVQVGQHDKLLTQYQPAAGMLQSAV